MCALEGQKQHEVSRESEAAMRLVPKQLRRTRITGDVPYYGGRLSPAQAYAASHPSPPPSGSAVSDHDEALRALRHLRDADVLTADEYNELCKRVSKADPPS
jgi:hypothetical protein